MATGELSDCVIAAHASFLAGAWPKTLAELKSFHAQAVAEFTLRSPSPLAREVIKVFERNRDAAVSMALTRAFRTAPAAGGWDDERLLLAMQELQSWVQADDQSMQPINRLAEGSSIGLVLGSFEEAL